MPSERALLEQYVQAGKLMQLASLSGDGSPMVCNVWYDAHFAPDVLRFISRHDCQHSHNVRVDGRVAGEIIAIPLDGLGQTVRGVTFTGSARELPNYGINEEIAAFVTRWPRAEAALNPSKLARGEIPTRLYEVAIAEWVILTKRISPSSRAR
jgi:uncharacterized protein YhbP (UPF0306 family)